jgi:hypothetical protein
VEIRPAAVLPDDYDPIVVVRVARSDKVDRRVRSTNDAYGMYRQPVEKWATSQPAPPRPDQLEQMPNDKRLADQIALEIRARAYQLLKDNPPRTYPK